MIIKVTIPKLKITTQIEGNKSICKLNKCKPVFKTPFVVTINETTGKEEVVIVDNLNLLSGQSDSGYIL